MSDSGGFFRVRLPSIKLAGASLSTLGRGRMGIFCSRLRTGRAVAAPAQRRLFGVSATPQAQCSITEQANTIRKPKARCIKLSIPGLAPF
jgi:hypothetical protein